MKRLRVTGLVGFAKQVRQELAGPVSAERLAELRRRIDATIASIEQVAQDEDVPVLSMPSPSRRAYQFLKGLDLSTVAPADALAAGRLPPESVSFRGLQSYFDDLLNRLARSASPAEQEAIYGEIVASSENIENGIKVKQARPEQLKRPARQMRAWLAYFSQRENFDEYGAAVRRAEPIFRAACTWPAAKSGATLVHFRPLQGIYRIRTGPQALLVRLPTPMICFNEGLLRAVADIAFQRGGDRKLVHDATGSECYQRVVAALELLGGMVAQTRGLHHDLAASFERVNAAYFDGGMRRPRLVWSRTFAARQFGHYDHAHDTVVVNAALDRKAVPEFAVDFIVYHELLHKRLGLRWQNNRGAAHAPEFRERERQFQQYDEAKAVIRKLASER
jgi:hypothetical protein